MLKTRTLGIIFANMHESAVSDLTKERSMAAVPFWGRYRLVDFYLSSMVDASITTIGVITKSNYQSLMDHIGNARDWDLARRKGLTMLPPYSFSNSDNAVAYHGRVEALSRVAGYIKDQDVEYVLLTDCDHVCHPDFKGIVERHAKSGADVTIICRTPDCAPENVKNSVCVRTDENGRVTSMLCNKVEEDYLQSMNMMVIAKDKLLELVADAKARMKSFFEVDILAADLEGLYVRAEKYDGFVRRVTDMKSYYDISMEMIDPANVDSFVDGRAIRTKVHDFPPVRYGLESCVKNSVVADGSIIEGTVENCVIFRGVTVEAGAVVRNSVLMGGTTVKEGAQLDCVITDKNVTVTKSLSGAETYPLYVKKGSTV